MEGDSCEVTDSSLEALPKSRADVHGWRDDRAAAEIVGTLSKGNLRFLR